MFVCPGGVRGAELPRRQEAGVDGAGQPQAGRLHPHQDPRHVGGPAGGATPAGDVEISPPGETRQAEFSPLQRGRNVSQQS